MFTWQPAKEFVENIRGTIRKNTMTQVSVNRIMGKLSVIPLYFLWFILRLIEEKVHHGGLLVVYAITQ